jgi:uncharacterized protein (DUF169 family)
LYQHLTARFTDLLGLQHPPIGLAFVLTPPEGVARVSQRVPSACTFWRLAEQGVFYANAQDHQACPIGLITMGLAMSEGTQQRAQELVQTMAAVQYFSPDEVDALPVVDRPHEAIVYGRLDRFPGEAEVLLCILDTRQAMLIAEAAGHSNWLQEGGQAAFGRPTCAVIPRSLHAGTSSVSFGCVGARTYIGLAAGELVLTLPAARFAGLVERLEVVVAANNALAPFHQSQKEASGAL